ncbi:MAG: hypothetical protein AAFX58_01460 [Pseudomonadota bacterium]
MARSSSYAVAFGAGFAAATLLLAAAGWLQPEPPAPPAGPAFTWPPARPAAAGAADRDETLLADCRARLAALLGQYPLTFERRSGELKPETLPLLHGIAEISADCPAAVLIVALPGDGADAELIGARRETVQKRLAQLGVPTGVTAATPTPDAPLDFGYTVPQAGPTP